jgi:hypothetical protein
VVVPAEIVKLPNEVTTVVGRVFVAPNITVPVLGVQVFVPVPPNAIPPFIVSELPLVIVIVPGALLVAFPIVKLPTVIAAPLTNVIVPVLPAPPAPPNTTAPETVSTGLPVAANVSVPVLPAVAFLPKVREPQAAFAMSTVTVYPLSTYTTSPATG